MNCRQATHQVHKGTLILFRVGVLGWILWEILCILLDNWVKVLERTHIYVIKLSISMIM